MGRVLIIDDAVTVRMFHRKLVEACGHTVAEAENGVEGLEVLANQPAFDLLLVDINMPQMDGYRFVQAVREDPQTAGTPAIVISTEAQDTDRERAYAAGANLYIVKPCDPDRLTQLLEFLLGRAGNESDRHTAGASA